MLTLQAWPNPARFDLSPGSKAQLQVRVGLEGPERGSLSMQLRGDGALVEHPQGLRIAVQSCTRPFRIAAGESSCSGHARTVLPTSRLASVATRTSSAVWTLEDLTQRIPRYLLVTLSLPQQPDAAIAGLHGEYAVGLYAAGDNQAAQPNARIANTGLDVMGPTLLALGIIGMGVIVRRVRSSGAASSPFRDGHEVAS